MNKSNRRGQYLPAYVRTTISLDKKVYTRLKNRGKFGDSFNSLLNRVLDELDGERERQ